MPDSIWPRLRASRRRVELPDDDQGYALDDPRHPAAPIVLDVDEPRIDSQFDEDADR